MSSFLTVTGVRKSFAGTPVLAGIDLEVGQGETVALLGSSGSGKTTFLRVLAGFESADGGRIQVAGQEVTGLPPAKRNFGMVFQHYALFPHLTVGDNVAFGLNARGIRGERAGARVAEVLALVDLAGYGERRVGEISGGQQQRVALARALAPEPRVLLLDEPLSNLDPALRERTRRELKAALRRVGITTLLVTHEQEEAFDFGDRVAVLHGGHLEQVARPEELYRAPASRYVATFVGRASVLPATVVDGERVALVGSECEWTSAEAGRFGPGDPVEVVVRPEHLVLAAGAGPGALAGTVVESRFGGAFSLVVVKLVTGSEVEVMVEEEGPRAGEEVGVALRREGGAHLFAAPNAPKTSGEAE